MKQQINDIRKQFKLVYHGSINEGQKGLWDRCIIYKNKENLLNLKVFLLDDKEVEYQFNISTVLEFEKVGL